MSEPAPTRAASFASSVVEHAPFGMFRIAADGAILEANPAVARLLGYERAADLLPLSLDADILADPGDLPRLRAAFDADPPEPFQTTWRRRDRSLLIVRTLGRRVAPARGAVAYDCWTGDLGAHADAQSRFHALIEHTFDLITLFAPEAVLQARVAEVLAAAAGRPGHIFNLGHGIVPETPVEAVLQVVEQIKQLPPR